MTRIGSSSPRHPQPTSTPEGATRTNQAQGAQPAQTSTASARPQPQASTASHDLLPSAAGAPARTPSAGFLGRLRGVAANAKPYRTSESYVRSSGWGRALGENTARVDAQPNDSTDVRGELDFDAQDRLRGGRVDVNTRTDRGDRLRGGVDVRDGGNRVSVNGEVHTSNGTHLRGSATRNNGRLDAEVLGRGSVSERTDIGGNLRVRDGRVSGVGEVSVRTGENSDVHGRLGYENGVWEIDADGRRSLGENGEIRGGAGVRDGQLHGRVNTSHNLGENTTVDTHATLDRGEVGLGGAVRTTLGENHSIDADVSLHSSADVDASVRTTHELSDRTTLRTDTSLRGDDLSIGADVRHRTDNSTVHADVRVEDGRVVGGVDATHRLTDNNEVHGRVDLNGRDVRVSTESSHRIGEHSTVRLGASLSGDNLTLDGRSDHRLGDNVTVRNEASLRNGEAELGTSATVRAGEDTELRGSLTLGSRGLEGRADINHDITDRTELNGSVTLRNGDLEGRTDVTHRHTDGSRTTLRLDADEATVRHNGRERGGGLRWGRETNYNVESDRGVTTTRRERAALRGDSREVTFSENRSVGTLEDGETTRRIRIPLNVTIREIEAGFERTRGVTFADGVSTLHSKEDGLTARTDGRVYAENALIARGSGRLTTRGVEGETHLNAHVHLAGVEGEFRISSPKRNIGGEEVDLNVALRGRTSLGAELNAEMDVAVNVWPPKAVVGGHFMAFAGARAEGTVDIGVGALISGSASVEGWVGQGVEGRLGVGYDDGKLKLSVGAGAAFHLGGKVRMDVEVDLKRAAHVAHELADLDDDGRLTLNDTAKATTIAMDMGADAVDHGVDRVISGLDADGNGRFSVLDLRMRLGQATEAVASGARRLAGGAMSALGHGENEAPTQSEAATPAAQAPESPAPATATTQAPAGQADNPPGTFLGRTARTAGRMTVRGMQMAGAMATEIGDLNEDGKLNTQDLAHAGKATVDAAKALGRDVKDALDANDDGRINHKDVGGIGVAAGKAVGRGVRQAGRAAHRTLDVNDDGQLDRQDIGAAGQAIAETTSRVVSGAKSAVVRTLDADDNGQLELEDVKHVGRAIGSAARNVGEKAHSFLDANDDGSLGLSDASHVGRRAVSLAQDVAGEVASQVSTATDTLYEGSVSAYRRARGSMQRLGHFFGFAEAPSPSSNTTAPPA